MPFKEYYKLKAKLELTPEEKLKLGRMKEVDNNPKGRSFRNKVANYPVPEEDYRAFLRIKYSILNYSEVIS